MKNQNSLNVVNTFFNQLNKKEGNDSFLNFTQDYSELKCPVDLVKITIPYIKKDYNFKAPVEGVLSLRDKISRKTARLYSREYHPENEIIITAGSDQALFTTISTFINEGDEAVIFEPANSLYGKAVVASGGIPKYISLNPPYFQVDWEAVQKIVTANTKLIIINTPHNPSGSIWSSFNMEKLQKTIMGTKIVILSNEEFEHVIFEGFEHQSVARFPELADKSIIVSSFAHLFNISGWKIGYCLGPESLMEKVRWNHSFQVNSVNTPLQYALAEFLNADDNYSEVSKVYQGKRDYFVNLFRKIELPVRPSSGTFFQLVDFKDVSDENDLEISLRMLNRLSVGVMPLSLYYHEGILHKFLRFNFAKPEHKLKAVAEKLRKFIS
ncbi:MAG: aminotransferase class I/II-fold pyridoxal phosphate-dependent enzyme [Bacteroidales bacterium]|nr:MAG: aminotransferase class I/II-fold pyridoxal phosphate-dependent enzyme [Bacteroidales bacterium]